MIRPHSSRRREGFTLIELLTVVAIMAVLAALITGGAQAVRTAQKVRTSETTVAKLQEGVDAQVKMIVDQVIKERANRNLRSAEFTALLPYCDGDEDRTAALLTYCRLRQAFPVTAAELGNPAGFTIGGVPFRRPAAFAVLQGVNGPPEQVAAAALYIALSKRSLAGGEFSGEGTVGAEMDLTLNGISCRVYKDAWGEPITLLRFYQSAELDSPEYANTKTPHRDPFDPLGKLAANWSHKTDAEGVLGLTFNDRNRALVVLSAGKNKAFDTLTGPLMLDDILGYRLRKIGARGAKL